MAAQKVIRFDWAIKKILRDKANFDILEGFLSALLEDNELRILKLLESESNQEEQDDKFNRVDILVEDCKKQKIIIEVQNTRESDYLERLIFGTSKTIIDKHQLGKRYKEINKVISISILYFNLGTGDDYLYKGTTEFIGMNTGNPLIVKEKIETTDNYGKIEIKFEEKDIFPEYYLIRVEKYQNIVRKAIDEWVYMFKNNEVKDEFKSKNIEKAAQKLKEMNMTEAQKKLYDRFLDNLARQEDQIETAKEEGFEIGEKKGIEKGIEIGEKKGIEKGVEKQQTKTVIEGFKNGLSIEILMKITGLSETEINEILKANNLK
jgi:predicted transposase/invertase (TIGR01784 family)